MTTTDLPPLQLAVGGMTCAGCASTIQRGLAILPGVGGADVNVATRRATVRPDGSIDPAELEDMMRAAIEGLGYQVLSPKAATDAAGADGTDAASHGSHGMVLADEHAAHLAADAARIADYRRRFVVGAVLAVPTVLLSMIPALQFAGWEWLAAALATPVIWWSGWPFHRSAAKGARHRATTMDTLVSVGSLAAWGWSMWQLLAGTHGHVYFETGAVIIALIVLGKWLEVRSTSRAGDAIRALSSRQVASVVLEDGTEIAREALEVGMRFVVRPGATIATDGVVLEGEAAVDASLVTGESAPVAVTVGAAVVGGTIATDGALTVEATRVGSETMLAQIARMVDEAQQGKADVQRLADRIAAVFVPIVLIIAAGTLAGWLIATGDASRAVAAAVAVLIISCPCALGLATPLAVMAGVGRGAQWGVLIRGPRVLEDSRKLTAVVLDKTGTVTEGRMAVIAVETPGLSDADAAALLGAAAAVESRSEHPVAAAIAAAFPRTAAIKGFRSHPGRGAVATVQGAGAAGANADVTVGSRRLFDEVPEALAAWAASQETEGCTVVLVGRSAPLGGGLLGGSEGLTTRGALAAEAGIAVRDTVKDHARDAVAALKSAGLSVTLLTGDNEGAARAVAREVGIDDVIAGVLPADKADVIERLRSEGHRVAMVGDGVNDAPALAAADVGIAIGTGADVAREASDLTLVSGDVRGVATAIGLARRTLAIIRGNLFWAFAYNVVAIPAAANGLLNPMIAAAAMGASSLFVVGNSLRLTRYSPRA